MKQFKTWTNNLEKDAVKIPDTEKMITRIEYRNQDRFEKTIKVMAMKTQMPVTKGYAERKNITPFGIGTTFEDLKMNSVVSTVQRENVWHPYYELNIEAEMDFKDQLQSNMKKRAEQDINGKEVQALMDELNQTNENFRQINENRKLAEQGLPPKKSFNIQAKMAELKRRDEEEENQQVIDPYTIKVRKVQDEMTEAELLEMMVKFGEVVRVKIPRDDFGKSKGIGFATFRREEDATTVAEEGHVRYDYYELPVEKATMSKQRRDQMEANKNRGDRGGGFGGGDRGDRGERREYRERRDGDRRDGGERRDGGGGRGGYRRNEPDSGPLRRNIAR